MNKQIKTLATVALSLSFAAHGIAYATNSDKVIRDKLNNSINAHDDIDHDVKVIVKDGEVTLKGEVDNKGEKALAQRLAVNTPGVTSVKNLLVIDKD